MDKEAPAHLLAYPQLAVREAYCGAVATAAACRTVAAPIYAQLDSGPCLYNSVDEPSGGEEPCKAAARAAGMSGSGGQVFFTQILAPSAGGQQ